jgi:zinc protease
VLRAPQLVQLTERGVRWAAAFERLAADALARALLARLPPVPCSRLLPLPPVAEVPPLAKASELRVPFKSTQAHLLIGQPGFKRDDPDFFALVVGNHILGGGSFSARLFKEVREKRGLAYSVHSQLMNRDHCAQFTGGTSTKNERAAESLAVIQEEIDKLLTDGPSEDELEKAKKYLIGSYALRFDTSTKIAGHLVAMQTDGYPVEFLDARNGMVAAVTMTDVKSIAKRLFDGKSLLVAAAGRPEGF